MSIQIHAKNFFLTYPQCDLDIEDAINQIQDKATAKYICCSKENHHETDGTHLHILVMLEKQLYVRDQAFWDLRNPFEGHAGFHGHYEACRAPKATLTYVQKDGNWREVGVCPFRSMLSIAQKNQMMREGQLIKMIDEGYISMERLPGLVKALNLYKHLVQRNQREKPEVYWFYGQTGTGKTKAAIEKAGDKSWWISSDFQWFDGYEGQEVAILDDVRAGSFRFNWLLRLLDRYPVQVPVKGGFVDWVPKIIIITAPLRPEDLFVDKETKEPWDHIDQLLRRITEVKEYVYAETQPPSEEYEFLWQASVRRDENDAESAWQTEKDSSNTPLDGCLSN